MHDNNVITLVALRRSCRGSRDGSGGTVRADLFSSQKVISAVTRASRKIDPSALPEAAARWLRRQDTEELTCLSFGFSSCFGGHKDVMCDYCLNFCASSVENGFKKKKKRNRMQQCEKPRHNKHQKSRYAENPIRCYRFLRKFNFIPKLDNIETSQVVVI